MSGLKVIDINNVEGEERIPPRTSWILVSEKAVGAQNLAVGYNKTHPGGMVPEHKHDHEEEVMYFISGKGKFVTDHDEFDLKPGICVYNPPGGMHKIINTGDEDLEFIWIYAPQLSSHRK